MSCILFVLSYIYRKTILKMLYIPKRYIIAMMAHFGFFVVYALRVNLSVALVAMVNSSYNGGGLNRDPECQSENRTLQSRKTGEFNWNEKQQGLILSSFFYGYLFTQVPGGWWASKYGGKKLFGIGVLCTSIFTMLTTIAARTNFYLLLLIRVLEGIGEGVTFPAMHALIALWAPMCERSTMVVFAHSGIHTGTIVALPVSGLLAGSSFLGGWPSVFYVLGFVGFIWYLLWCLLVTSSPEQHPTISEEEKQYILSGNERGPTKSQHVAIPWLQILKSTPVWACVVANFYTGWVFFMVLTELPAYFDEILAFNLKENGFLSALPFLVSFCMTVMFGILADYLIKKHLSATTTRKLMTFIGCYPTAVFLILASYTGCHEKALSVIFMALATGTVVINTPGFNANIIDLSQNYSGIIMGICNFAGTVAGCIVPSITGILINGNPTRSQYRKVFAIAATILCIGGLFYMVAGDCRRQSWDVIDTTQTTSASSQTLLFDQEHSEDKSNNSEDRLLSPVVDA